MRRIGTDAAIGRLRRTPRTVADLDAAALARLIGRPVASVEVIDGDAGTSSRARLTLTGDDVPASVFVKMAAETVATRLMGELGNLADTETRFYRQLAPELTGVPTSYGSAFDPWTGRFVLVLEDLADPCAPRVNSPTRCTRSIPTGPPWWSSCWLSCTGRSGVDCRRRPVPVRWAGCTPRRRTAPHCSPRRC